MLIQKSFSKESVILVPRLGSPGECREHRLEGLAVHNIGSIGKESFFKMVSQHLKQAKIVTDA